MKLEELIQKRFTEREELTKFLAKFGDYPAVFSPEAPKAVSYTHLTLPTTPYV